MQKLVVSLFLLMFAIVPQSLMNAARADDIENSKCVRAAQNIPMIKLMYNYGNLVFDNTKSKMQISQICGRNTAGCFIHNFGKYSAEGGRKVVDIGNKHCVIPQIAIKFDFTGSSIYILSESSSCTARVLLRHELQHFTIWRTAVDGMLDQLKMKLKEMALQDVYECNDKNYCDKKILRKVVRLTENVVGKWQRISRANNERLDEVDHDNETEFAYRSCSPYSLKIINKFQ